MIKTSVPDQNFKSVEHFLEYLPTGELAIVCKLRALLLENIPDVTEKLAYNVPYYYRHRRICFIWPSCIQWGKVKLGGVLLGFCQGHIFKDKDYFTMESRKKVAARTFHSISDINEDLLRYHLSEAVIIDNSFQP